MRGQGSLVASKGGLPNLKAGGADRWSYSNRQIADRIQRHSRTNAPRPMGMLLRTRTHRHRRAHPRTQNWRWPQLAAANIWRKAGNSNGRVNDEPQRTIRKLTTWRHGCQVCGGGSLAALDDGVLRPVDGTDFLRFFVAITQLDDSVDGYREPFSALLNDPLLARVQIRC